jgi:hypothetical protein
MSIAAYVLDARLRLVGKPPALRHVLRHFQGLFKRFICRAESSSISMHCPLQQIAQVPDVGSWASQM